MLEIKNISKAYADNKVLDDISFDFSAPGFYGLIGANGSGKSTLLSIIAGILRPDVGDIYLGGKRLSSRGEFVKSVAYVAQDDQLIYDATVLDNLKFFFDAYGADIKDFLNGNTLDELNLRDSLKKRADKLSGGMRKKLSILTSLANNAPVLILDEPTGSLDIPSKLEIFKILQGYLSEGKLIVMSSHDEFELSNTEHILMLKNGKLQHVGSDFEFDRISFE